MNLKLDPTNTSYEDTIPSIDICLVACRRPELIAATLESFNENLLRHLDIMQAYVNLDPYMGTSEDGEESVKIIKSFFPKAIIFEPEKPDFCKAVRRIWKASTADLVMHLEDDWLLDKPVDPIALLSKIKSTTKAVSFLSEQHGQRGESEFSEVYRKKKIFGITYSRHTESRFNTSPTLFCGNFLRQLAAGLDIDLDPEKQLRLNGGNRFLYRICQEYRCAFFKSSDGRPIIVDIGRQWRESQGIEKTLDNGQSYWKSLKQPD